MEVRRYRDAKGIMGVPTRDCTGTILRNAQIIEDSGLGVEESELRSANEPIVKHKVLAHPVTFSKSGCECAVKG